MQTERTYPIHHALELLPVAQQESIGDVASQKWTAKNFYNCRYNYSFL